MLMPKKVKHRKWQKGRTKGNATSKIALNFGSFGLKALDTKWVTARQLEASRRVVSNFIKRGGKLWIRVFPDKPITTKSAEVPMGGGKGAVDHYVAVVKPGTIILELDGVAADIATEALTLAGHKLPVRTKIISK
ncbi:MAG: 50S ribosomal protein L16 [Patescibacteria group bacterium]